MEIARRLKDLEVEKLICGGIQNQNKAWLMGKGIMVVDNQKGVWPGKLAGLSWLRLTPPESTSTFHLQWQRS